MLTFVFGFLVEKRSKTPLPPLGGGTSLQQAVSASSAEMKTDTSGLFTVFGHAYAYKILSHKTYMVIPKSSSGEDRARPESLSMIFGIGLIFFDSARIDNPDFEIRVRPL
jgi:hypothetical protein